MPDSVDTAATQRIEGALALLRERAPEHERDALLAFAQAYLSGVDAEDLRERDVLDLYGAVRSLWQFAGTREPGQPKVRVFNPSVDEHGWQSTHTVVEIVNDDMPFLVDSMQMELLRQRLTLHFIAHPIVEMPRDGTARVAGSAKGRAPRESLMHIEVDRLAEPGRRNALAADIVRVLGDVRTVVTDWSAMRERMLAIDAELGSATLPHPPEEIGETRAFLQWLADNHFTFVGYRCHDAVDVADGVGLAIVPGSGLGLLRPQSGETLSASFMQLPARLRARARAPGLLVITKSNSRSTVHRPGYLDYIGIRRFDASGAIVGEHRFIGLYTSAAYSAIPEGIPLLRRKVARILAATGFAPGSHAYKSLVNILDTYPRDELFQIGEEELAATALGILKLEGRARLRLFVRQDLYERFVSCLIYAPRERYTTELRKRWQALLVEAFRGTGAEFAVLLSESPLVRVLITVRTQPGQVPDVDRDTLEQRLAEASRRWEDDFAEALHRTLDEARAAPLARRYANAFPAAYREDFPARAAAADLALVERALATGEVAMNLYRPVEAGAGQLRFKLARRGGPVWLSEALPMLERMGLTVIEERPYRVAPEGAERVWLHDYGLQVEGADVDVDDVREHFEDAFARVMRGELESDDFNRLVLTARLSADEVVVLRAYGRYLRQLGFPLSQAFIEATLAAHPAIAAQLVRLFRLRFDPAGTDAEAEPRQVRAIELALEKVANLNEDRVLREFVALIHATTRTNFWRRGPDGARRPFLSFKLDPAKVPGMPAPRPKFEIWVYAPRFEGVHLRGGPVARGGLRWSDRPRGLPHRGPRAWSRRRWSRTPSSCRSGSKGGFVLKRAPSPADRDAWLAEGIACYKDVHLRALLDLTDNLTATADRPAAGRACATTATTPISWSPPTRARRRSPTSPTASPPSTASGSATRSPPAARSATTTRRWASPRAAPGSRSSATSARSGIDTQAQPTSPSSASATCRATSSATACCSRAHIRLVAAFDHRHVFLDPDPDAARVARRARAPVRPAALELGRLRRRR